MLENLIKLKSVLNYKQKTNFYNFINVFNNVS